jgi:hypothetical protein
MWKSDYVEKRLCEKVIMWKIDYVEK